MKNSRMPVIRAVFQIVFWLAFVTIIVLTRETSENTAFLTNLPRLSPYLGISLLFASGGAIKSYWPALLLVILTLIIGRLFCGWICPLGCTIDAADKLIAPADNSKNRTILKRLSVKSYKYIILSISLVLGFFGLQIAGIIDPLSLSIRSYGTVLYSYFDAGSKLFFDKLYYVPGVNLISEPFYSILKKYVIDINATQYYHHFAVFGIFIAIILISVFARRFWCRSLCPLGAVYAITSAAAPFRRTVDAEKCTACLKCERGCRMSAIYDEGTSTRHGECIKCFDCLKSCKFGAIEFKFISPLKQKKTVTVTQPEISEMPMFTRKKILATLLAAAVAVPALKRKPGYTADHSGLIRPPGALPEDDFLNTCVRCGQCMKVCPTNALHPLLLEYGLHPAFSPRLIPRIGYCEKNCNQCGQVCPSGAIKKIRIEDKDKIIIGTAVIIKDLCLPWSEQKECLVCEEMCPTSRKAIIFKDEYQLNKDGKIARVKLPVVLENLCIGCGICENKCPIPGSAAIKIIMPKIILPGGYGY
jgi:MauM/NapG family ferredoxin protein